MPQRSSLILAVDFDGTCVDHRYPDVGADVPGAVYAMHLFREVIGAQIILWTIRSGPQLEAAEVWFAHRGIPLLGVNSNPGQATWSQSPKAYAHAYIDDAAVGCPLTYVPGFARPVVDWAAVMDHVTKIFIEKKKKHQQR